MTVSESYPTIYLGGLSKRILSKNWHYVFRKKKPFVLKTMFLVLGLGMGEEVNEGSRCGDR